MKLKVLGIFFLLSAGLSCATGPGAKQAKVYQNDLATMLGKEKNELIAAITGWNFGLMDSWDADNFTIIRAVFRDDHLLNFKVWPDVTSRDVSGLKVMRRGGPPQ